MKSKHFAWIYLMVLFGSRKFLAAQDPFITTWTTVDDLTITIPTRGAGYHFDVDWGDGSGVESGFTGDASHTYGMADTFTVTISGDFPRIYFANGSEKDKILSVEQWGDMVWTSMDSAFYGCSKLVIIASDAPDLLTVTSMSYMLAECTLFNQEISHWTVSNVEDMSQLFADATTFNRDISSWNVSQVKNMSYMFAGAVSYRSTLLRKWDVNQVEDMSHMFEWATNFRTGLRNWQVIEVRDMSYMFAGATSFNGNIENWGCESSGGYESYVCRCNQF